MATTSGIGRIGLMAMDLGEREQEFDNNGWAHIHHAAFNGYQKSVLRFINTKPDRLEILTQDDQGLTPLLIACISGQRETVDTLIELGADINALDQKMLGAVELAALNDNTNLLEYFLSKHSARVNVIRRLFNCLSENDNNCELEMAACESLQLLSGNAAICEKILDNDGISLLLQHLKSKLASEKSKDLCLNIIMNIASFILINDQIIKFGGVPILIDSLSTNLPSITLKAVKMIGMLAGYGGKDVKHSIDELSGITSILAILQNTVDNPDLVIECLDTLTVLVSYDSKMQNGLISHSEGLAILVDLLENSEDSAIIIATLKALIGIVTENTHTQAMFADLNGIKGLMNTLKSKSSDCTVSAVLLAQRVAYRNQRNQELFIKQGSVKILTRILKRSHHMDGKAAAAGALWAIAGSKFHQRRAIATFMGISTCLEFLGSSVPNELQYYGSEALHTLTKGVGNEIDDLAKAGSVQRLLHILGNTSTPSYVALSILKSLRSLCIAPGYFPHTKNQKISVCEGAIRIILNYARTGRSEYEKAESYYTLGAVTYANKDNLLAIKKTSDFSYIDVLTLLYSSNSHVKEIAGSALALLAFDCKKQLREIASAGGIPYQHFVPFLISEDKFCVAHTAFQMAVLSKIIPDEAPALTSATGIKILVDLLDSDNEEIQALSSDLICGLSNLKSGVPDAIISIGTVKRLCKLLCSPFDIVQASVSVTLCQLMHRPEGQRQFLNACRHDPYLFKVLQRFPHRVQLSDEFQKRWRHCRTIGLPPIRYLLLMSFERLLQEQFDLSDFLIFIFLAMGLPFLDTFYKCKLVVKKCFHSF